MRNGSIDFYLFIFSDLSSGNAKAARSCLTKAGYEAF